MTEQLIYSVQQQLIKLTNRKFSKKYIALYESVTGETFTMVRESEDIYTRIQKNLSTAVPDYF